MTAAIVAIVMVLTLALCAAIGGLVVCVYLLCRKVSERDSVFLDGIIAQTATLQSAMWHRGMNDARSLGEAKGTWAGWKQNPPPRAVRHNLDEPEDLDKPLEVGRN